MVYKKKLNKYIYIYIFFNLNDVIIIDEFQKMKSENSIIKKIRNIF